jgi:hypothetical protein
VSPDNFYYFPQGENSNRKRVSVNTKVYFFCKGEGGWEKNNLYTEKCISLYNAGRRKALLCNECYSSISSLSHFVPFSGLRASLFGEIMFNWTLKGEGNWPFSEMRGQGGRETHTWITKLPDTSAHRGSFQRGKIQNTHFWAFLFFEAFGLTRINSI